MRECARRTGNRGRGRERGRGRFKDGSSLRIKTRRLAGAKRRRATKCARDPEIEEEEEEEEDEDFGADEMALQRLITPLPYFSVFRVVNCASECKTKLLQNMIGRILLSKGMRDELHR